MINHFLKLGGVRTVKEFYKKFPTEAHFDRHVQKKYGGGLYAYDDGGEPAPYEGVSIVDFLKSQGKASEFSKRKELAEKLGISGYKGKAEENTKLLQMLRQSPDLMKDYASGPVVNFDESSPTSSGTKKSGSAQTSDQEAVQTDDDGNPIIPIALGAAGAGAGAYGIYKFLSNSKAGRASQLVRDLSKIGLPEAQATKLISEATGDAAKILEGIHQRGAYTVDELRQLMKLGYGSSAQNVASNLPKAVKTASEASRVQRALSSGEKIAEAAIKNPSKYKWLKNFGEAAYDIARAGYLGAKDAGLVKLIGRFGRLEYGGDIDDFERLHRQTKLGYYADAGEVGDWTVAGHHVPGWLKTAIQVGDPTGISSWGDAGRAMKEAYEHPGWGSIGNAALETLGAAPIIGKFGKAAKIAKIVGEGEKVGKLAKGLELFEKAYKPISKPIEAVTNARIPIPFTGLGVKPFKAIEQLDELLPTSKAVMHSTDRLLTRTNAPKVLRSTLEFGTDLNRIGRWQKGLKAGLDSVFGVNDTKKQKMGGQPCYNCGGRYKRGGQTLHPGGDGTYYQGTYFDDGGTFVPDYGAAVYGQLPQYELGKAMYGSGAMELGGPTYSKVTQYNHQGIVPAFDWMQDGGSPLYSTQGQALRNFMNTVGYTPGGWMPNHIELPPVGKYDDGGMAPGQQQGQSFDPQQVMQVAAQKLQQGEQPQQVMQELMQAGIPQNMAMQIVQQVMQQLQAAQGQQAGQEMMEGQAPQAMYGMGMRYGGSTKKRGKLAKSYEVGGEYEMSNSDIEKLIAQGYKIEYL